MVISAGIAKGSSSWLGSSASDWISPSAGSRLAVDEADKEVFNRKLPRDKVLGFLGALPPCEVALEACCSSHYWGREIERLGHRVRLISPNYVKPFVKRGKSDAHDARAIREAASRPDMRFVPGQLLRDIAPLSPGKDRVEIGWRALQRGLDPTVASPVASAGLHASKAL